MSRMTVRCQGTEYVRGCSLQNTYSVDESKQIIFRYFLVEVEIRKKRVGLYEKTISVEGADSAQYSSRQL